MGKVIDFGSLETPWTARFEEYGSGIMAGRFHNGAFEDIHFDTIGEYITWKKTINAKVNENW